MASPSDHLAVPSSPARNREKWLGAGVALGGLFIAVGIGFDDLELTSYQLEFADLLLKGLGGLAVFGSIARYLYERNQELAWDKTRFIVELFENFDQNSHCQRAKDLIDDVFATGDSRYLEKILQHQARLRRGELADRRCVDRYLDFFDRLYTHVFITETLSIEDVSSFSGYVTDIYKNQAVRQFALRWGYEDVLLFARAFRASASKRNRIIDELLGS